MAVQPERSQSNGAIEIKFQIDGGKQRIDLQPNADGSYSYILNAGQPDAETLTPAQLADRLYRGAADHTWLQRLFNISSPIGFLWVTIGLLGQVLFTGRMLVQWFATEKNRQSVVPPIFWWMSLIGSLMLLTYFLWRRDIVGVLGQSFGLIVYIRNLYFIHGLTKSAGIQSSDADGKPD